MYIGAAAVKMLIVCLARSLHSLCTFGSNSFHGKIAQCSALLTDRHNRCISILASVDLVFSAAHQVHNTTNNVVTRRTRLSRLMHFASKEILFLKLYKKDILFTFII